MTNKKEYMKVYMREWRKTEKGKAQLVKDAAHQKTERFLMVKSKYRGSEHGMAVSRKYEESASAKGRHATNMAKSRAKSKAYLAELFAEAPEKRIHREAKSVVVLSDLQIPFEDPQAVNQALEVIDRVRPEMVILNGDIIDCYAESSFLKDPRKAKLSVAESHKRARQLMECLQDVPKKIWIDGNHEDRWNRILLAQEERGSNHPVVENLLAHAKANGKDIDLSPGADSLAMIYGMADYGFEHYPYSHRLYLAEGNLIVTHGKYVSRHGGQSAKRTWEWLGTSCIVGHTHRLGHYPITQDGKVMGAWENGCLCQLEPEYDDAPNWQQGFSVVKIDGPTFHVVQVPIIRRGGQALAMCDGLARS